MKLAIISIVPFWVSEADPQRETKVNKNLSEQRLIFQMYRINQEI